MNVKDTTTELTFNLSQHEERFQLLVDQAGDAFFILDYEGTIHDANHRACLSLGYSREELLGLNITDVDVDVDPKQHRQELWDALEAGEHVTFEGTHRRKGGSTFPVEVRLGRLDMPTEKLLLALARDITERKQKENHLERHREFENLVATISTRFVGLSGPELEQSIQTTLGDIGSFFDVDAVRLYRLSLQGSVLKFRLNWSSEHLAPPQEMKVIKEGFIPILPLITQGGNRLCLAALRNGHKSLSCAKLWSSLGQGLVLVSR